MAEQVLAPCLRMRCNAAFPSRLLGTPRSQTSTNVPARTAPTRGSRPCELTAERGRRRPVIAPCNQLARTGLLQIVPRRDFTVTSLAPLGGSRPSGDMGLFEFDSQSVAPEEPLRLVLPSSEEVGGLTQHVVSNAVDSLWSFYSRHLPDGGQWAVAKSPDSLQKLASELATPQGLLAACFEILGHEALRPAERNAIASLIAEALGFKEMLLGEECVRGCNAKLLPVESGEGRANGRGSSRPDIFLFTDVRCNEAYFRVRLRNLSEGGVMIVGAAGLEPRVRIAVKISGHWIDGAVAWSLGNRCGIGFDRPL